MSNNEKFKNIATFKSDKVKELWSRDDLILRSLRGESGRGFSRNESIAKKIQDAKNDPVKLRAISIEAKSSQGYADVINYYKTMFQYRYVVYPSRKDHTIKNDGSSILEVTNQMLTIINSLNLEGVLPNILETGLFEGYATLFVEGEKDKAVTYMLPNEYSKQFMLSNYGTYTVLFDLVYFDELIDELSTERNISAISRQGNKNKKEETNRQDSAQQKADVTMEILSYFPKFLQATYLEYAGLDKSGKKIEGTRVSDNSLVALPIENAAIIPFSPSLAPPKIKVTTAEETYDNMIDIQSKKFKTGLDKILVNKIPNYEGDLLISLVEAQQMQTSMSRYLNQGEANVTVLTSIGDVELLEMQKEANERSKVVSEAYNSQYESAHINPELFRANTDYALSVSLARDASFVWDILQKVMTFYNLTINELFDFGNYNCRVNLLPITSYNEEEVTTEYRRNAEYGIGKLEAIIANGQRQSDIVDKLLLEDEMNLDEMLTPLQSSHTRSAKEVGQEKADIEETEVDNKDNDQNEDKKKDKEEAEVKDEQKED